MGEGFGYRPPEAEGFRSLSSDWERAAAEAGQTPEFGREAGVESAREKLEKDARKLALTVLAIRIYRTSKARDLVARAAIKRIGQLIRQADAVHRKDPRSGPQNA